MTNTQEMLNNTFSKATIEFKNKYTKIAYDYYILNPNFDTQNVLKFVEITKIPIDKIWINDFWKIIDNEWILIDERRINQLGYKMSIDKYSAIRKLLKKHFIENEDYRISRKELAENIEKSNEKPNKKQNGGQNRKMYDVTAETFKIMLMKANTDRAREIRSYFIVVEKLFLAYFEFQCLVKNYNYEKQIEELTKLQHIKVFSRNNEFQRIENKLKQDIGVVYFIRESKSKYYKVGFTYHLAERIEQLQTGNRKDLLVYKYFICHSPSLLETIIHKDLKEYNIKGEWFKLEKSFINSIIHKYKK